MRMRLVRGMVTQILLLSHHIFFEWQYAKKEDNKDEEDSTLQDIHCKDHSSNGGNDKGTEEDSFEALQCAARCGSSLTQNSKEGSY